MSLVVRFVTVSKVKRSISRLITNSHVVLTLTWTFVTSSMLVTAWTEGITSIYTFFRNLVLTMLSSASFLCLLWVWIVTKVSNLYARQKSKQLKCLFSCLLCTSHNLMKVFRDFFPKVAQRDFASLFCFTFLLQWSKLGKPKANRIVNKFIFASVLSSWI